MILTSTEANSILNTLYRIQEKADAIKNDYNMGEEDNFYITLDLQDLLYEVDELVGEFEHLSQLCEILEGNPEVEFGVSMEELIQRSMGYTTEDRSSTKTIARRVTDKTIHPDFIHTGKVDTKPKEKKADDWGGFKIVRKQKG